MRTLRSSTTKNCKIHANRCTQRIESCNFCGRRTKCAHAQNSNPYANFVLYAVVDLVPKKKKIEKGSGQTCTCTSQNYVSCNSLHMVYTSRPIPIPQHCVRWTVIGVNSVMSRCATCGEFLVIAAYILCVPHGVYMYTPCTCTLEFPGQQLTIRY